MKEHSQLTKRHPKNTEERTKLERSTDIALRVLETEHHVDFDNPEILSEYWPIYRDRRNAEQLFISHQPEAKPPIQLIKTFIFHLCKKCPLQQLLIIDLWFEIVNYCLRLYKFLLIHWRRRRP